MAATRSSVWSLIVDAERREAWWPELELEPRLGGSVAERWSEGEGPDRVARDASGEVDVFVDGHAIGFRWSEAGDERPTAVLITLRSLEEGTAVVVTETGFDALPGASARAAASAEGWQVLMQDLETAAEAASGQQEDPEPREDRGSEAVAEESAGVGPSVEEPAAEEPSVEDPAEGPGAEELAPEGPGAEELAPEGPGTEVPEAEERSADVPDAMESSTEAPAAGESTEPAVEPGESTESGTVSDGTPPTPADAVDPEEARPTVEAGSEGSASDSGGSAGSASDAGGSAGSATDAGDGLDGDAWDELGFDDLIRGSGDDRGR
ncbi:SRPBCC domain-containing protein [Leucobacter sp. CSA1]|uniref:SRPBCC domain-containing protein n=1 Tax=Leucobacter chromiisoli TaxID=2796471 RepID=A0A934UU55_9MICO|nr:SRPBCC domain-containing protein [Leucobacter chromiisoli]MBK0417828.1 SRPBCC domain-containing protein [Leucobacter chromiisoli]